MEWLTGERASLPVDPETIHFIKTPAEFYSTIIDKIKQAKSRIILSSLYLGTGSLEVELVNTLESAVEAHPDMEVGILLDYLRGTRGSPQKSSVTMLQPLAEKAELCFYHTPDLRGVIKEYLPERVNEVVGLQHMKFYIFDDSVIISGANLSDSYFVDRQDRYVLIQNNPDLVDYFHSVFRAIGDCSFHLKANGKLELSGQCDVHPFLGDRNDYCSFTNERIHSVISNVQAKASELASKTKCADTVVYPFLQFGPFKVNDEVEMLTKLFSRSFNDIDVTVATGYFNPHEDYLDLILRRSNYPLKFLYAAPDANGFYGAQGMSGGIPAAYVNFSKMFFDQSAALNKQIQFYEYSRPKWTFHGKGVWIDDERNKISATILGSSNYGYRSATRDLESQVLLVTTNEPLRQRLADEKRNLMEFTSLVDANTFMKRDHFVPFWVRVVSRVIRHFL